MKYCITYCILSILMFTSCSKNVWHINKTSNQYYEINNDVNENAFIAKYLQPYKQHIDNELNKIISYCPENLDKSDGKWQNTMTNFYADAILETGNALFYKKTGKNIDGCMLNYGGIRSAIGKGNITIKTAFDIMPFENSAIVLGMDYDALYDMAKYIIENKKAHPISGIEIIVNEKSETIKVIKINHKNIEKDKIYYIITNDYLAKGGDQMYFFQKAKSSYVLDYKLRNMFIDYFSKYDTLPLYKNPRIIFE